MQFKGSVGTGGTITWANLPAAAASNNGFTYKVITDHNTAPICKAGDTIVSNGTSWVVIPSGDEPSGTVTSVAIGTDGGITISGSPITTSGTIKISHADTSSQSSVSNSGRTYIQSVTLDTYGHVTALTSASETVINSWRPVAAGNNTLNDTTTTLTVAGSSGINASLSISGTTKGTLTISPSSGYIIPTETAFNNKITHDDLSAEAPLTYTGQGSFGLSYDNNSLELTTG